MSNLSEHSVTLFIRQLQDGDDDAALPVWNHFFGRLAHLARKNLHTRARRVIDEEDVALQALDECIRGLQAGKFAPIADRDNQWAILATIAERRAWNTNEKLLNQKRGSGRVHGDSVFIRSDNSVAFGANSMVAQEPTPEYAAVFAEEIDIRLNQLTGKERKVATLRMQGYKNREVADVLGCTIKNVELKLNRIRRKWTEIEHQTDNGRDR